MSNIRFELNRAGVRELLKSEEMKAIVSERATQAASALGEGFSSDTFTGANRVNAMVSADTYEAKKKNAQTNCILKAVGI